MIIKCKACGETNEVKDEQKTFVCELCGLEQTLPVAKDEEKAKGFVDAYSLRYDCKFDVAQKKFEELIKKYPDENEGYWGKLLCKYGIEYVKDSVSGKMIPTCHRTVTESIFDNSDYKYAIKHATSQERAIYEAEAKEIDRIQKEILEIADKSEPFDIFICYKETDRDGKRTRDSQFASKVYTNLTEKGYKVFFARETLKGMAGAKYEPIIYSALMSAKVMLHVTTSREYTDAPWVRNEWSRYLEFMHSDDNKAILPCIGFIDAYDLPEELSVYQAMNMSDFDFIENLIRQIDSKFGHVEHKKKKLSEKDEKTLNECSDKIARSLSEGNFIKAGKLADEILRIDSQNADACLVKTYCEFQVKNLDDLVKKDGWMGNHYYINAKDLADKELRDRLLRAENEWYYVRAIQLFKTDLTVEENYEKAHTYLEKAGNYNDAKQKIKELEKERDRQIKIKRRKTVAAIICSVAAVAVIVVLVFTLIIPIVSFTKANELMNAGKYDDAMAIYKELGGWGNSGNKLDVIDGIKTVESGEYEQGINELLDSGAEVTVSYNCEGGSLESTIPVFTASPHTDSGANSENTFVYSGANTFDGLKHPTRKGYVFKNWTLTGTSSTVDMETSKVKLAFKAVWEEKEYSITYRMNGGTAVNVQGYSIGDETFTLTNPTKDGYAFIGWTGTDLAGLTMTVTITKGSTGSREYTANWEANAYKVSYNANGGEADKKEEYVLFDALFTPSATAERKGYKFVCWEYNGEEFDGGSWKLTQPITLVARWEVIEYSISYKLNGGKATNPTTYTVEDAITLTEPTKEGYKFTGWTGTDLTEKEVYVELQKGNIGNREYTASWTAVEYDIVYKLSGGTATNKTAYTIEDNFVLTAPERKGYEFVGWTGTGLSGLTATVRISSETGNREYTANWEIIEYDITYNLDGGVASNPDTYTVEDTVTLNEPTKTGYTFAGWTGTDILSNTLKVVIVKGSTGNRSYTAHWATNSYLVEFDTDGGEHIPSVNVEYHTPIDNKLPETATKTGHKFVGWFADPELTEAVTMGTVIDCNTKLYAKYEKEVYRVTFNANGGDAVGTRDVVYGDQIGELPTSEKTGHTLEGWYLEAGYLNRASATLVIEKDITLHAKWTPIIYTVSFNTNGGNAVPDVKVAYGEEIGNLPTSSKTGHMLEGWYLNSGLTEKASENTVITKSIVLYAKWIAVYTVSFDVAGGTAIPSVTVIKDTKLGDNLPKTATMALGYSFGGWYSDSAYNTTVTADTVVSKNLIIYAKPIAKTYTVSGTSANGKVYWSTSQITTSGGSTSLSAAYNSTVYWRIEANTGYSRTQQNYGSFKVNVGDFTVDHEKLTAIRTFTACTAKTYTVSGTSTNGKVYWSTSQITTSGGSTSLSAAYNSTVYWRIEANTGYTRPQTYYGQLVLNGSNFTANHTSLTATKTFTACTVKAYTVSGTSANGKVYWSTSQITTSGGSTSLKANYNSTVYWRIEANAGYSRPQTYYGQLVLNGSNFTANHTSLTATKTFTACTVNTYTLNYNINAPTYALSSEKSQSVASTTWKYGTTMTLTTKTVKFTGYKFKGWATSANSTTVISGGNVSVNLSQANIQLYAVWEIDPYTIGKANVTNGTRVSDVFGNKYFVFNDIHNTPSITKALDDTLVYPAFKGMSWEEWKDLKIVADWSSYAGVNSVANYRDIIGSKVQKPGSGYINANLSILTGVSDVYFIGNPTVEYQELYIFTVGYEVNQKFTMHFKDMNIVADCGADEAIIDSWYGNDHKDVGMDLTLDFHGTNKFIAAHTFSGTPIGMHKNVTITGDGSLEVTGSKDIATIARVAAIKAENLTIDKNVKLNATTGIEVTALKTTFATNVSNLPFANQSKHPFVGWYTAQTGGSKVTGSVSANTKIYARYDGYIAISTKEGLSNIRNNTGGNYKLIDNVDLSEMNFEPINSFSGILDGNGHSINGFKISITSGTAQATEQYGLFKVNTGTIKNLYMKSSSVTINFSTHENGGNGSALTQMDVGILCGENRGTITNVYIQSCSVSAKGGENEDKNRTVNAGGLCGRSSGTITKCAVTYSSVYGEVKVRNATAYARAGAVVGYVSGGTLNNVYAYNNSYLKVWSRCGHSAGGLFGAGSWYGKVVGEVGEIAGRSDIQISRCLTYNNTTSYASEAGRDEDKTFPTDSVFVANNNGKSASECYDLASTADGQAYCATFGWNYNGGTPKFN